MRVAVNALLTLASIAVVVAILGAIVGVFVGSLAGAAMFVFEALR